MVLGALYSATSPVTLYHVRTPRHAARLIETYVEACIVNTGKRVPATSATYIKCNVCLCLCLCLPACLYVCACLHMHEHVFMDLNAC